MKHLKRLVAGFTNDNFSVMAITLMMFGTWALANESLNYFFDVFDSYYPSAHLFNRLSNFVNLILLACWLLIACSIAYVLGWNQVDEDSINIQR